MSLQYFEVQDHGSIKRKLSTDHAKIGQDIRIKVRRIILQVN